MTTEIKKISEEEGGYVPGNEYADVYVDYTGSKCKTTQSMK